MEAEEVGAAGLMAGVPSIRYVFNIVCLVNEYSPAVVDAYFVDGPASAFQSLDEEDVVLSVAIGRYKVGEIERGVAFAHDVVHDEVEVIVAVASVDGLEAYQ